MLPVPSEILTILFLVLLAVAGGWLVGFTLLSAMRAIVLPRSERVALNAAVFGTVRWLLVRISQRGATYAERDRVMALIGPVGLLALPIVWLTLVSVGYTPLYYAAGIRDWLHADDVSGSALLTLNAPPERLGMLIQVLVFSEGSLGLLMIALLITYLPTIYSAFTRREAVLAQLELRAGMPVSAAGLIVWLHQSGGLRDPQAAGGGTDVWAHWETWFLDIEESHTSLPVLSLFRSREPGRSWVTAAALVLDATTLLAACVEAPTDPQRTLCLKAGVITVHRVARFFTERGQTDYDEPHEAVTFPRERFADAYALLAAADVPLRENEEAAWETFTELRGRYQQAINQLAHIAMAPGPQ